MLLRFCDFEKVSESLGVEFGFKELTAILSNLKTTEDFSLAGFHVVEEFLTEIQEQKIINHLGNLEYSKTLDNRGQIFSCTLDELPQHCTSQDISTLLQQEIPATLAKEVIWFLYCLVFLKGFTLVFEKKIFFSSKTTLNSLRKN